MTPQKMTSNKRTTNKKQKESATFEEYCERHGERIGQRFVDIRNEVTALIEDLNEAKEPDELDAAVRAISGKTANRIIANGLRDFEEWYSEALPELLSFLCKEEGLDMPEYEPNIRKGWLSEALRESSEELVSQVSEIHDVARDFAAIIRKYAGDSWVSDAFENFYMGFTNPIEGVRRTLKAFTGDSPEQKEVEKADARLQDALRAYDDASEAFHDAAANVATEQLKAEISAFAEFIGGNEENGPAETYPRETSSVEPSSDAIESRLKKLNSLFEKGLISQAEFNTKRKQILSTI